jgi:hypothetical protein
LKEEIMQNPAFAKILMIVGILVVLISALADSLGLGRHPGFGWVQGLGVIIGALAIAVGLYLRRRIKVAF